MKRIIIYIVSVLFMLPALAQQSLTLNDCREMALKNNVKMQQQQMALENASLQKKEAITHMFPSVSAMGMTFKAHNDLVNLSVPTDEIVPVVTSVATMMPDLAPLLGGLEMPENISALNDGTIGAVMAMWPIFAGGRVFNGTRLAQVGYDVLKLQMQQTEREIKLTAEQYYWQVISLEEKLNTIRSMKKLLQSLESDVQTAVNAGLATRNDLLQVQLQQGQVESGLVTLQSNYTICRMLLSQYIGLGLDTMFTLQIDSKSSLKKLDEEINTPDDIIVNANDAVNSTIESELLQQNINAKKLQYKMEIGKHLPTIALGGCYYYDNLMSDDGENNGMVFATVSVPITDWWGGSYAMKREKNAQKTAEMDFQDIQQKLLIGIQVAETNLRDAWQQVHIAKRNIEQSDENLRLEQDYYSAGTATMSELLQAQSLNQQSHDKYVDAWIQYQIKRLEYLQTIGATI